eukprot:2453085-Heterocapsa_arctica.AAC.1
MDRSRECRHQKNHESYNTDDIKLSCCKCKHYDNTQDVTYGHKVDKHIQTLMTISSMGKDCGTNNL